jgi:hypothetical protein
VKPQPLNRPLRIIRAACFLGLAELIVLFFFCTLHPLNTKSMEIGPAIRQTALGGAILIFPYICLFASTFFVRELRVMSWLLLVPAALVLLVMSWGCFTFAVVADSFLREQAAGRRSMNCAGFPFMFEVPLAYLISLGALVISAVSFGAYYGVIRSADRNLPPPEIPLHKFSPP